MQDLHNGGGKDEQMLRTRLGVLGKSHSFWGLFALARHLRGGSRNSGLADGQPAYKQTH
jgi:hypothetical protein